MYRLATIAVRYTCTVQSQYTAKPNRRNFRVWNSYRHYGYFRRRFFGGLDLQLYRTSYAARST